MLHKKSRISSVGRVHLLDAVVKRVLGSGKFWVKVDVWVQEYVLGSRRVFKSGRRLGAGRGLRSGRFLWGRGGGRWAMKNRAAQFSQKGLEVGRTDFRVWGLGLNIADSGSRSRVWNLGG